jgi:outer membrane lipoprotein SlyB
MTSNSTTPTQPIATQSVFSRPAALFGGAIGLVALTAIATTLAVGPPSQGDADKRSGSSAPMLALASPAPRNSTPPEAPADFPEKTAPPAAASPERASPAPAAKAAPKPVHVQRGSVQAAAGSQRSASVCATCGKVESVTAVKQKGEGTGLGVVGGAVVGGLLGSQVGGGGGKSVATVLGAVGGGVAGNEVEKRSRATTTYQVRVRMDDGSVRTVTQATAPAVGQKVTVEGSTLRAQASTS